MTRARRLYDAIRATLQSAINHRGSSISDYVDVAGASGGFQNLHNVYGKAGSPCPRCGAAIRRTVIAQRGTDYCPKCQRVTDLFVPTLCRIVSTTFTTLFIAFMS